MRRKELALAAIISSAIAVAILSMPDVLRPAAESLLRALGLYWPAAVLLIGVIHGLKPDEHTWPITVSYGMMQESLGKALISTGVFAGALTLVWASLSALTSQVLSFFQGEGLEAYVDIVVGLTMVTVAGALLTWRRGHGASAGSREARADYKVIWVHGVAAAFGGDFFIVFYMTVILLPVMSASMGFAVGLLFGLGPWVAQSAVVAMMYKGLIKAVRDVSLLTSAGRLSLLFLRVFMIGLGVFLVNGRRSGPQAPRGCPDLSGAGAREDLLITTPRVGSPLTKVKDKPRPLGRGKAFKLLLATSVVGARVPATEPIRVRKETKEELNRLKVHPRETYDDVITRLIEEYKRCRHEKG